MTAFLPDLNKPTLTLQARGNSKECKDVVLIGTPEKDHASLSDEGVLTTLQHNAIHLEISGN